MKKFNLKIQKKESKSGNIYDLIIISSYDNHITNTISIPYDKFIERIRFDVESITNEILNVFFEKQKQIIDLQYFAKNLNNKEKVKISQINLKQYVTDEWGGRNGGFKHFDLIERCSLQISVYEKLKLNYEYKQKDRSHSLSECYISNDEFEKGKKIIDSAKKYVKILEKRFSEHCKNNKSAFSNIIERSKKENVTIYYR